MNDICKARRGQVWFLVNPNAPVEYQGSVQGKNRPWLIVSNDKCNEHSPTFSAVPVTTAAKKPLPVHVHFNDGKLDQIILCEQQQTFPMTLLTSQGSYYKYALSSDVMDRVNEALSIQNGLKLQIPNADRFWQSIEQLIKSRVKEALSYSKIEALDVSKLSALIDAKVTDMVNAEVKTEKQEEPKVEPTPVVTVKAETAPVVTPKHNKVKKTRNKWTTESKKEFLDDFDKYTTEKMTEKYGMTLKTLYATRSLFKKQVRHG